MISEATIRAAMRDAPRLGKTAMELKDEGARGEGRLAMIVRLGKTRLSTEWYAVWYSGGKRRMAKLGSYPTMGLAEARKTFRETYSPAISKGQDPEGPRKRREKGNTVEELFKAYCDNLDTQGKHSASARRCLIGSIKAGDDAKAGSAARAIGNHCRASDVTHKNIIPYLKAIHDRGSIGAAAHARAYISAAFSFAMRSANSYSQPAGNVDWEVGFNPVTAIPYDTAANKVGTRYLVPAEFRHFWKWLLGRKSGAAPLLMTCMATGQRLTEILCLTNSQAIADAYATKGLRLGVINAHEKTLDWSKTKNKQPHCIPLPKQAMDILAAVPIGTSGLLFPHRRDPKKLMTINASEQLVDQYLLENPQIARFTPRDLRRTWKTLSGAAGMSKEIRDRLQNHARSDVSSRHYDRYDYITEKRTAMNVWEDHLDKILSGATDAPVATFIGEGTA